jgi:phage RecT family recombinase
MSDSNVATINKPPIVALRERLLDRRSELRSALPSDIDPDHFIRAVTTAAQINPDLQACSFSSLWLACMRACRDGLLPDGVQGAIVPFKSSCSWIPMYQGLLKKFRQSGQCKWITAQIVRNGEEFVHHIDEGGEKFRHVPGDDDTLPIEKVYAAALTKDGAFYITVLSMNEIKKIQNLSKASREDAPWKVWPTEMMKKTALRRLAKLLPSGRDIIDDDDNLPITPGPSLAPTPLVGGGPAMSAQDSAVPEVGGEHEDGGGEVERAAAVNSDPIVEAYTRGSRAPADGLSRKAMPPEYRTPDRSRESMAWQCGYDGKPMPTWSDEQP